MFPRFEAFFRLFWCSQLNKRFIPAGVMKPFASLDFRFDAANASLQRHQAVAHGAGLVLQCCKSHSRPFVV